MKANFKKTPQTRTIEVLTATQLRRALRIPIANSATSARYISLDNSLDSLSLTLQSFEITDKSITSLSTPPTKLSKRATTRMGKDSLIQPFSGIGYKPLHVKMYLKGVQVTVNKTAEDEEDKKELYSMYFYNRLQGEAKL